MNKQTKPFNLFLFIVVCGIALTMLYNFVLNSETEPVSYSEATALFEAESVRSFYTKDKAIRTPADLKGLKIRTMDSQMAIDMMNNLGGSATVMGYSDIYTGLQQGVIDGAENNVTALRDHGDVAKFYSFDEHTRIPDIVVLSADVWNSMSDAQKEVMKSCAAAATNEYKAAWKAFEDTVLEAAVNNNGVELVRDVDIAAFQAAVAPIYDNLKASDPDVYAVVEKIRAAAAQ